jgi:hypothetical protein
MENYFLELLLIAEKGKIDEYVKYTEADGASNNSDIHMGLPGDFLWSKTEEGWGFWNGIWEEARRLSGREWL